ncbi:MAG TPA: YkgJ family cysteine cluster protein [Kiritimatiellia bacterium]|nr:YkgJ family cysteine cluster protein [Kiritimatiellia bacterium]HMP00356.1 YkgJ family cysteine cluster protein [Kiritimatiellia bacterium]HMP96039.1 YkgJ family cysteine cluster protein [Kiritimatiellia bacterium]
MKPKTIPGDRPYFFDHGLCFECTGCGQCCTGESGTIFINDREAEEIAVRLGMEKAAFLADYAYPYKGGHSIKEKENGDCIFLNGTLCGIYEARPTQCRTFPFWPEILRSEAKWNAAAKGCEGIGRGRRYEKEEILTILNRVMNECQDAEW